MQSYPPSPYPIRHRPHSISTRATLGGGKHYRKIAGVPGFFGLDQIRSLPNISSRHFQQALALFLNIILRAKWVQLPTRSPIGDIRTAPLGALGRLEGAVGCFMFLLLILLWSPVLTADFVRTPPSLGNLQLVVWWLGSGPRAGPGRLHPGQTLKFSFEVPSFQSRHLHNMQSLRFHCNLTDFQQTRESLS